MRHLALSALTAAVSLSACADETISGYADPTRIYHLTEIDGKPFLSSATISFPNKGRIAGTGPCNAYSGTQSAPYPWFAPGPLAVTKRACADLDAETDFLAALTGMTLAEISGPVLILSDDTGRELIFRAR